MTMPFMPERAEPQPEPEPQAPAPPPREQLTRCPKHGRIYDAARETGCSQCAKEGTTADAPGPVALPGGATRGLPTWLLLLLLLALLGVLVVPRLVRKPSAAAAPAPERPAAAVAGAGGEDDISRGAPRGARYNPATYQSALQNLETALYVEAERSPYTATALVRTAANALTDSVAARAPRDRNTPDFTRALGATVARLDSSGGAGYVLPDFYAARGNWERIRAEFFERAPWYHAPMAAELGVGAGGAAAAAHEDPAAFHQANAFADDLERIVTTYRAPLVGFADPPPTPPVRRGRRAPRPPPVPADYRAFADRMNGELAVASGLGPSHWYRVDRDAAPRFARSRTALSRALGTLRGAVPVDRVRTRADRGAALDSALSDIRAGRQALVASP